MPNLDTHAGIALRTHPEGGIEFAAGEVFDDAVRIAGGLPKLVGVPASPFADGIHSNPQTDAVFDRLPPLVAAKKAMSEDLEEVGYTRTATNVHVGIGTDILFSAVTLQRSFDISAYLEACDFLLSGTGRQLAQEYARVDTRAPKPLDQVHLAVIGLASHGIRAEYTDPAFVVRRVLARARTRPRLAQYLTGGIDDTLIKIYAAQQARLAYAADDIYHGTVSALKAEGPKAAEAALGSPLLPIMPHVSTLVENIHDVHSTSQIALWRSVLQAELKHRNIRHELAARKFVATRAAAHFLLQNIHSLGEEPLTQSGRDAPQFPEGVVGSLTHSEDWAAASIADAGVYRGLGIDLECWTRVKGRDRVLTPYERTLPGIDAISTRTLFSIKESIFKAIHPLVREQHPRKFWYQDAEIAVVDSAQDLVQIRLTGTDRGRTISKLLGDVLIEGRFIDKQDYSSSVVTIQA